VMGQHEKPDLNRRPTPAISGATAGIVAPMGDFVFLRFGASRLHVPRGPTNSGDLQQCIAPTKPGSMSRFAIHTVQVKSPRERPLTRPCVALPCAAPRRAAREGQEQGNPRNIELERNAYAATPAHVHSAHAAFFLLLERRLQPTPSPICALASCPLLGACSMFPGE
jgi:hypothetical protein